MSFLQTSVSGFPAVSLRNDEMEFVVVPAIGAKITNLRRRRGREWLWRNPDIPIGLPADPLASPTAYVDRADSGGWDECFPTIGATPVPGSPAAGLWLPDHGELWAADWTSRVYDHVGGTTFSSHTCGRALPYEFHREVTLDPAEPLVHFAYRLRHVGGPPFPWIWASHPLLNVRAGSTVALDGVGTVTVIGVTGRDDLVAGQDVPWPLDGGTVFRHPGAAGWSAMVFARSSGTGQVTVTDPQVGEQFEMRFSPQEIPQTGVWINAGGWAPPGKTVYTNLGLEPGIGAPDSLANAVDRWRLAPLLHQGEERAWSFSVTLREADD